MASPDSLYHDGEYFSLFLLQYVTWLDRSVNAQGVPASGADGLTLDSEGRVYAACATGVQVFGQQGQYLGTIPIPRQPQNLSFAGADKKTLYIVGRGVASRVPMIAHGLVERAR